MVLGPMPGTRPHAYACWISHRLGEVREIEPADSGPTRWAFVIKLPADDKGGFNLRAATLHNLHTDPRLLHATAPGTAECDIRGGERDRLAETRRPTQGITA